MVGSALAALAALAVLSAATPYGPGERMTFSVRYLGLRVGIIEIASPASDDGTSPVQLAARTIGIGAIYRLDERITSFLDPVTSLPIRTQLDADEKGRRHQERTAFDRVGGTATVRKERVRLDGSLSVETEEVPIPPDATDLLSLVYRLRTMSLAPGDRRLFPVLSGAKLREVMVAVEAREDLETDAGRFSTLRIRVPTGFNGNFEEKHPTLVWLSDDARRIVVRLSTDFAIGGAVAELRSYAPGAQPLSSAE